MTPSGVSETTQTNSAIRVIMMIRILLYPEHWRRGLRLPSEKQFPPPLQTMPSFSCCYWLPSERQTRPGSATGIKGCAPVGDRNVAKTSATPLVRFTAL